MKISIRYKFILPLLVFSITTVCLVSLILYTLHDVNKLEKALASRFIEVNHVRAIETAANQLVLPHLTHFVTPDVKSKQELKTSINRIEKVLDTLLGMDVNGPKEKALVSFILSQQKHIMRDSFTILQLIDSDYKRVIELMGKMINNHLKPAQEYISKWYNFKIHQIENSYIESLDLYKRNMIYLVLSLVAMFFLITYTLLINRKKLVKPILGLSCFAQRVISDREQKKSVLSPKNEIDALASNINNMAASLKSMRKQLGITGNGSLNRTALVKRLGVEISNKTASDLELAVVMFDINQFKEITKRNGIFVSKNILRQIPDLCLQNMRSCDSLFHVEKEKFMMLLPNVNKEGAWQAVERCRQRMQDHEFVVDVCKVKLTANFGIAFCPANISSPADLIKLAYDALNLAKKLGRNRTADIQQQRIAELA